MRSQYDDYFILIFWYSRHSAFLFCCLWKRIFNSNTVCLHLGCVLIFCQYLFDTRCVGSCIGDLLFLLVWFHYPIFCMMFFCLNLCVFPVFELQFSLLPGCQYFVYSLIFWSPHVFLTPVNLGRLLPKFWDSLSVPSARVKQFSPGAAWLLKVRPL
jgi:hypothetical protein